MLEYHLSEKTKFITANQKKFSERGNVIVERHMFQLQEGRSQPHSVFNVIVKGNVLSR
jgi:uncharacterized protein YbgA (DUF1722 family)